MSKGVVPLRFTPAPWVAEAACRGLDPNLFFPKRDDEGGVAQALAVCATCPVTRACMEYAIANYLDEGVWGNTSARQRRAIATARHRGHRHALEYQSSDKTEPLA